MAGREFGPPPYIVSEFSVIWRNWLNLVYRKIYKRTYVIELPAINSASPSLGMMTDTVIGNGGFVLADDTTNEFRNFSFLLPVDWVVGSDLIVTINFANTTNQTGVKTVITKITYYPFTFSELVNGAGTVLTDTLSLPSNVLANTFHESGDLIIPGSELGLNDTVFLYLERDATNDTCVGDVAYQSIAVTYTGLINHE